MTAVSLKLLHDELIQVAPDDRQHCPTAGYRHRLEQLRETHQHLNRVIGELRDVASALDLLLQLLNTPESQPIYADLLRCLLSPLHEKMKQSLSGLDELV